MAKTGATVGDLLAKDMTRAQASELISAAVAKGVVYGGLRLMLLAFLVGLLFGLVRAIM